VVPQGELGVAAHEASTLRQRAAVAESALHRAETAAAATVGAAKEEAAGATASAAAAKAAAAAAVEEAKRSCEAELVKVGAFCGCGVWACVAGRVRV